MADYSVDNRSTKFGGLILKFRGKGDKMQELGIEQNLEIKVIDKETETRAENLIKRGLEEHFGTYDDSYNPDLKGIIKNYIEQGHIFLVGVYQEKPRIIE